MIHYDLLLFTFFVTLYFGLDFLFLLLFLEKNELVFIGLFYLVLEENEKNNN